MEAPEPASVPVPDSLPPVGATTGSAGVAMPGGMWSTPPPPMPPLPPPRPNHTLRTVLIILGITVTLMCACAGGLVGFATWQTNQLLAPIFRKMTLATPRPGEVGSVEAICFTPDGQTLVAGYGGLFLQDHAIRLWNLRRPQASPTVLLSRDGGGSTPPSPGRGSTVYLNSTGVTAVRVSPEGRRLAVADEAHAVRLWDLQNPATPLAVLAGVSGSGSTDGLAFSPDGMRLATAGDAGAQLWALSLVDSTPHPLRTLPGQAEAVAFSPDGRTLAVGGPNQILLWPLAEPTATPVQLTGVTTRTFDLVLAYSPDGHRLAASGPAAQVLIWDLDHPDAAPDVLREASPPVAGRSIPPTVSDVAFSADGRRLAAAFADGWVQVWDTGDWRAPPRRLALPDAHTVAFAADGRLAGGGLGLLDHGTVQVWDLDRPATAPVIFPDPHTYPYSER